ncbi:MAG: protein kinase [candidate division WOR-3 bacterium]
MSIQVFETSDFEITASNDGSKQTIETLSVKIHFARLKTTGQEVVLKKYTLSDNMDSLDRLYTYNSELVILKHLNQYPQTKSVKLYGICIEPNAVYLVLEKLDKTLTDLMTETVVENVKKHKILSEEQYKTLFYQILMAVDAIHSLGIIHNDLKLSNIMTCGNDIRIIDFGLSEFLGIGPLEELTQCYVCTEIIKAPDDDTHHQYCKTNRKSYASDSYSIGASMVQMICGEFFPIFTDYSKRKIKFIEPSQSSPRLQNKKNLVPILTKRIGDTGVDLLFRLLEPKTHLRLSCRQALNHPYFDQFNSGKLCAAPLFRTPNPYNQSLNDLYDKIKYFNFDQSTFRTLTGTLFHRLVKIYVKHSIYEYIDNQFEFAYFDQFHSHYQNDVIPMSEPVHSDNILSYHNFVYDLLNVWIEGSEVCIIFDSIANAMLSVKRSINDVPVSRSRSMLLMRGITFNIIHSTFMSTYPPYEECFNFAQIPDVTIKEWIDSIIEILVYQNRNKLSFLPIWSHIIYIIVKLIYNNRINLDNFSNLLISLQILISKWVLFYFCQTMSFEKELTTWELVQYCALRVLKHYSHLDYSEIMSTVPISWTIERSKIETLDQFYERGLNEYKSIECEKDGAHHKGYDYFREMYLESDQKLE